MKIKSNLNFNTSLLARHTKKGKGDQQVVIGGSQPEYMVVPAGASIELNDKAWQKFAGAAAPYLKAGHMKMVIAPLTKDELAAKAAEAAKAEKDSKPK